MVSAQTKKYGAAHVGCWFDNCRGIYIGDAIIREAIAHGWNCDVEPTEGPNWAPQPTWTDHEHYHELTDEAEDFMAQFAEEGFWFGYSEHSGDWGLWASEEEE